MTAFRRQLERFAAGLAALPGRLHRDERGAISVLMVFTIFMLTIVLGLVFNIARQLDDKLRMQNAADAATYSGTLTLSRGMNTLAFSNHLMCEVFALTAYMREGRQRYGESLVPEVLTTWLETGAVFEAVAGPTGYDKFRRLGRAIQEKVGYEQAVVTAFGELSVEHSRMTLPVFEYILRTDEGRPPSGNADVPPEVPDGGLIPRFQRAVVLATPQIAQAAAEQIARRHGQPGRARHELANLAAAVYRTDRIRLGEANEYDRDTRTLPAVDPSPTGFDRTASFDVYFLFAEEQRRALARHYLEAWIQHWMNRYFDHNRLAGRPGRTVASLSRLIDFWRIFTCAQLNKMLDQEFPTTNLPFMIRVRDGNNRDREALQPENETLHDEYNFVGVVGWTQLEETFPGVFGNPLNGDRRSPFDNTYAAAFAQGTMFIPQSRYRCCPWAESRVVFDPLTGPRTVWINYTDGWDSRWSLSNQNWRTRLEPVTTDAVVELLYRNPGGDVSDLLPPGLGGVSPADIRNISMH